ncbi:hypothetical protein BDN70DRAFT_887715 [Pholiota conissans]|uniref:F-box domain-containing protein n=1 Tax=Pholiota conissans TaxID=109636 RepID=A0A9P6CTP6_9AGAR|nr:hypothetical protein BDN70DRAFT_887715 [Pholiota conissans]
MMLVGLEKECVKLKAQVNKHHDPLLNRLPPEIVAEVFEQCIPAELPSVDPNCFLEEHTITAPLTISAVCKGWRNIAFSTPRLWKLLSIRPPTVSSIGLIKNWIDRAGQLPLSILLHLPDEDETAVQIMGIIKQYSTRLLDLRLRSCSALLSHFPSGIHDLPTLRSLHLYIFDGIWENITLNMHPQHLTSLSLHEIPLESLHFDCTLLTSLTINKVTLFESLETLCRAPNLKKCIFESLFIDNDNNETPTGPLIHYELCEFGIPGDLCRLFKNLWCPSLKALNFSDFNATASSIINFLKKSECLLERLCFLGETSLTVSEIDLICKSIPTLQHLSFAEIYDDVITIPFCNALSKLSTVAGKTEPLYLPSLHSLSFDLLKSCEEVYRLIPDIFGIYELPEYPSKQLHHRHALKSMTINISILDGVDEVEQTLKAVDEDIWKKIVQLKKAGIELTLPFGVHNQDLVELAAARLRMPLV